jgi:hypothetical protein
MNLKLLFKAILIIAVLALLVMMGKLNSDQTASLDLQPLFKIPKQPVCYMYYGFFGVGFIIGALMMAGGKKGSGKPAKEK